MATVEPAISIPAVDGQKPANGTDRSNLVARVVLPEPESADSDEEGDVEEINGEEPDDSDFLADFPDDTEDLELIHLRIGSLDGLHLARFAEHLRKICLRRNFVSYLDPEVFAQLTKLEELDLYDNRIKTVGDALNGLSKLEILDLSYNLLRAIPDTLHHNLLLHTVYFVQNRITKITGLDMAVNLRSLELGGNRIRKIENLDALVNLEELWLGKNKITKIENLGNLKKLKIMSIQSNRITKLEGLDGLESLQELYMSHNGIKCLEGLEHNTKLDTLDLCNNFIPELQNLSHLTSLQELWLSSNQIPNLHDLPTQLGHISTLQTVYLEGNPCQLNDMTAYRRKVILALPSLKQVDATYVRA